MLNSVFADIGSIIIIATFVAFIAKRFRQPLIPAYILAGLVIGPFLDFITGTTAIAAYFHIPQGFSLISDRSIIQTMSEIGIAFLLFMVGLEIDLRKLKDVERIAGIGGALQVILIFGIGFVASALMFFSRTESVYIGFILAFSSTMVVVKILSDKKELDTLHGRIIIGILLVQDIIAVFALMVLSSLGSLELWSFAAMFFGGIALILLAVYLSRFVFGRLFRNAAGSRELFFLLSLSICFLFSLFFSSVGLSIAVGAFVAGVSLGNLEYSLEITGRVRSIRDFFATLFFVSLGMQLPLAGLSRVLLPLMILTLIVLIIKPLVLLLIIGGFGYKKRTSFLTSISLAQVSEFSLIMVTQGMLLGQVSQELFTATILLAILTIGLSSYMLKYEYGLYSWLSRDLSLFEKLNTHEDKLEYLPKVEHEAILVGYDRMGYSIFRKLVKLKQKFMVIDYNPEIIKKLIRQKIPCLYGDAGNVEVLERLDFGKLKYLISTIPDLPTTLLLIKKTRQASQSVIIFVTAYQVDDALMLYKAGADYVVLPHFLGGHHASVLLEEATKDVSKLVRRKFRHIKELNNRKMLGHEHPRNHTHLPKEG